MVTVNGNLVKAACYLLNSNYITFCCFSEKNKTKPELLPFPLLKHCAAAGLTVSGVLFQTNPSHTFGQYRFSKADSQALLEL